MHARTTQYLPPVDIFAHGLLAKAAATLPLDSLKKVEGSCKARTGRQGADALLLFSVGASLVRSHLLASSSCHRLSATGVAAGDSDTDYICPISQVRWALMNKKNKARKNKCLSLY